MQLTPQQGFFDLVYRLVRSIPPGQVASYGQIAALLGHPRGARTVGWALNGLTESQAERVPWHRVVSQTGRLGISRLDMYAAALQRQLLEDEGVQFDEHGRVDMRRFGWRGLDPVEAVSLLLHNSNI